MNLFQSIREFFSIKPIDLQGRWEGHYEFGSQYSSLDRQRVVHFIAEFECRDNHTFSGTINEDSTGILEESTIEGYQRGTEIFFIKTYQNTYFTDDSQIIGQQQNIRYTAHYDSAAKKFNGKWQIERNYEPEIGDGPGGSGFWELSRNGDDDQNIP